MEPSTPRVGRFICDYAWRDVFARSDRHATVVSISTLAIATALAITVFGVLLAHKHAREERLRRSPFALTLWVGQNVVADRALSNERLGELNNRLKYHIAVSEFEMHPFREVEFVFCCANPDRQPFSLSGRTVSRGDPLIKRLLTADLLSESAPGSKMPRLIGTRRLLDFLGYNGQPQQLVVKGGFDTPKVDVPLVRVENWDLPNGHLFLILEDDYNLLVDKTSDVLAYRIRTGPIPEEWGNGAVDLGPARRLCKVHGLQDLRTSVTGSDGKEHWELTVKDSQPMSRSRWSEVLSSIANGIPAAPVARKEFIQVDLLGEVADKVRRQDFDFAGVTVKELKHLKLAANACREAGYPTAEDVIQQIDEINQSFGQMFWVSIFVLVAIGLSGFANINAIQELRSHQKQTEIGLIKAMGLPPTSLRSIYLIEGGLLWAAGTSFGMVAGVVADVALVECFVLQPGDAPLDAFPRTLGWIAVIPALTLIATTVSVILGTRKARRVSPMETIRVG